MIMTGSPSTRRKAFVACPLSIVLLCAVLSLLALLPSLAEAQFDETADRRHHHPGDPDDHDDDDHDTTDAPPSDWCPSDGPQDGPHNNNNNRPGSGRPQSDQASASGKSIIVLACVGAALLVGALVLTYCCCTRCRRQDSNRQAVKKGTSAGERRHAPTDNALAGCEPVVGIAVDGSHYTMEPVIGRTLDASTHRKLKDVDGCFGQNSGTTTAVDVVPPGYVLHDDDDASSVSSMFWGTTAEHPSTANTSMREPAADVVDANDDRVVRPMNPSKDAVVV